MIWCTQPDCHRGGKPDPDDNAGSEQAVAGWNADDPRFVAKPTCGRYSYRYLIEIDWE